jgi:bifunctional non-homologous end joining protein LigD
MRKRLEAISRHTAPFTEGLDGSLARHAHWVQPALVAETAFTEWTDEGKIRHPSFQGLRADKRPSEIRREQGVVRPGPDDAGRGTATVGEGDDVRRAKGQTRGTKRPTPAKAQGPEVGGVRISHPDRVMYPQVGLTKLDVARYYESVADRMLPHLRRRPLTLVRCGEGLRTGELRADCLYLKHSKVWAPESLQRVRIRERTKTGDYLIADSAVALLSLAQMDILEVHTWNSTCDHIERPDRLVFDIDPGPDVRWPQVVEAARLVRSVLQAVHLESFVKTTGGSGLHVVVPIVPTLGWDECLEFSRNVASAIVRTDPRRYTMAFRKAGRQRQLLIDYLRNNRTNTSIAAFSTRARPGATVSVPLAWDELTSRLRPERFTVRTVPRRVSRQARDPWEAYWRSRQSVTAGALRTVRSV